MESRAGPGSSKEEKQGLALTLYLRILVIVPMLSSPSWLMKVMQEVLLLFGVQVPLINGCIEGLVPCRE